MSIIDFLVAVNGVAQLYASDNQFLGLLSNNQYDVNSISNPHGMYGGTHGLYSINNPHGIYGGTHGLQVVDPDLLLGVYEQLSNSAPAYNPAWVFSVFR